MPRQQQHTRTLFSAVFAALSIILVVYSAIQLGYHLMIANYGERVSVQITHMPTPCIWNRTQKFEFIFKEEIFKKEIPNQSFCKHHSGDIIFLRHNPKYPKRFLWDDAKIDLDTTLPTLCLALLFMLITIRLRNSRPVSTKKRRTEKR
jgi:hypothetical protein